MHDGTRPGTHVLHAVLGPADAPGGVLLAAHGDVVDVAGQTWTSDPFSCAPTAAGSTDAGPPT